MPRNIKSTKRACDSMLAIQLEQQSKYPTATIITLVAMLDRDIKLETIVQSTILAMPNWTSKDSRIIPNHGSNYLRERSTAD